MILPKDFLNKIAYFEHTFHQDYGTHVYDVFTLHFKSWWRKNRVIKIKRKIDDYEGDSNSGTFTHQSTTSSVNLYNQLNEWSISTFKENTESIKKKYTTNNTNNVILLKNE